jgi:SlyX protein
MRGRIQTKERKMADMTQLEERMAELMRTVDDLSETIARQDKEITRLTARVEMLMRREAERESEGGGGVVFGDERPPHY